MGDLLQRASLSHNFLDSWDISVDDDASASAPAVTSPAVAPVASPEGKKPIQTGSKGVEVASAEPRPQDGQAKPAAAAEGKAADKPTGKAANKGDDAHGKVLYTNDCSACHQPSRAGLPPIFPALIGIVEKDGEAKVRKVAKEGIADAKPPMPPHPDLTDSDLDDLIAFLRSK
jgi:mono/diheme cytochrome c family protein